MWCTICSLLFRYVSCVILPVAGVWPDTTGRFLTSCGPGRGDVTGSDLAAERVTGRDLACDCDGWRTADARAGGLLDHTVFVC